MVMQPPKTSHMCLRSTSRMTRGRLLTRTRPNCSTSGIPIQDESAPVSTSARKEIILPGSRPN